MNSLPQPQTNVNPSVLAVYFNNGADARKPWHVGLKQGRAIVAGYGNFAQAKTAIQHAVSLAKVKNVAVITPEWLEVL